MHRGLRSYDDVLSDEAIGLMICSSPCEVASMLNVSVVGFLSLDPSNTELAHNKAHTPPDTFGSQNDYVPFFSFVFASSEIPKQSLLLLDGIYMPQTNNVIDKQLCASIPFPGDTSADT